VPDTITGWDALPKTFATLRTPEIKERGAMLCNWPHQLEMWPLLKIARTIADERVSPREHHYGTFCIERVCHRRQTARDAGSGGERRYADLAPQPRHRIGSMHGGLLVAKIDNFQFGPARPIVQRRDVPAGQCEDVPNPKLFDLASYQVAAVQPRQAVSATYRRRHGGGLADCCCL
jgi:hypothetical protein